MGVFLLMFLFFSCLSSESLLVGHFLWSLHFQLSHPSVVLQCEKTKHILHHPCIILIKCPLSHKHFLPFPKPTVIFRELHLSLVALGLQSFQLHQPLQAWQLQFIRFRRLFGRCCCSFPTYPWLQRHGICIMPANYAYNSPQVSFGKQKSCKDGSAVLW